jgi:hypothetical protein
MIYCMFNTRVETEVIGIQTSRITAWLRLVFFNVPFLIRCNSTTYSAIDTGTIALERPLCPISNDALDNVLIILQREL